MTIPLNQEPLLTELANAIKKEKQKLIKIAKTSGLYENFGQDEVRALEDKFIDISDYSPEMNKNRQLINQFDDWCMSYSG